MDSGLLAAMTPWIVACLSGLAITLFGEIRISTLLTLTGKGLAASAYLGAGIALGGFDTVYGRWMLLGMMCCWLGDLLLVARSSPRLFLAGLTAFLAGHLAYSAAFVSRGQALAAVLPAGFLMLLFGLGVWIWLRRSLDRRMRWPVMFYIVAISIMMSLAFGTWVGYGGPAIVAGAAMFFLSDLAVARNRFVAPGFVNRAWGLPLYFAGQLSLAASMAA